jgi:hypothetical protein
VTCIFYDTDIILTGSNNYMRHSFVIELNELWTDLERKIGRLKKNWPISHKIIFYFSGLQEYDVILFWYRCKMVIHFRLYSSQDHYMLSKLVTQNFVWDNLIILTYFANIKFDKFVAVLIDDIIFDLIDCIYPQYSYARYKYAKYMHIDAIEEAYKQSLVTKSLREHALTDWQEYFEDEILNAAKLDAQIYEAINLKSNTEIDKISDDDVDLYAKISDKEIDLYDNDLVEVGEDDVDYEQLFLWLSNSGNKAGVNRPNLKELPYLIDHISQLQLQSDFVENQWILRSFEFNL